MPLQRTYRGWTMLHSYSKSLNGTVACLLLLIMATPVYPKPLAPNFQHLQGLTCTVAIGPGGTVAYDGDGEPDKANGLKFTCEGKSVQLVNDVLTDGFFTTKQFGKFQVKRSGVFGTKAQSDALVHTFK